MPTFVAGRHRLSVVVTIDYSGHATGFRLAAVVYFLVPRKASGAQLTIMINKGGGYGNEEKILQHSMQILETQHVLASYSTMLRSRQPNVSIRIVRQ
uniref:Uncharacterized protein n=1 Tax=Romanomermis culicivorax TaxID=13658 RepID=A0A915LCI3_ROMCU